MILTNKPIKISGALFLIAIVSSLVGGRLIETAKEQPLFITGVILEVINALSVLGIGILIFPVLKQVWKSFACAYLGFRILETLACLSAALIPILALEEGFGLRSFYTGTLIPLFFCGGAMIFYTVLFIHRILPRFISIWGLTGVLLVIYLNVFQPPGKSIVLLALPIILNEIFMGIWLIMKGFSISN